MTKQYVEWSTDREIKIGVKEKERQGERESGRVGDSPRAKLC